MNRKWIVIKGKSNTGKSTIIRRSFNKFNDMPESEIVHPYICKGKSKDETIGTLRVNGKIIGFRSVGDDIKKLEASLNYFIKYNCEICVMTCRDNESHENFVSKISENKAYIIDVERLQDEKAWQSDNESKANEVISKIESFIKK